MGHLDKLKISNRTIPVARPRHKAETVEHRRNKLIANIEEQVELAQMVLQDRPPELQRKRGHTVVKVRPRLWWKVDSDGNVLAQILYNKITLDLARRGTTIEVGPLKKLPAVYRTVIKAIKAGELDRSIENAAR
jgi:hypothetical protein